MPVNIAQKPLYDSFVMLHPSGDVMCRCNRDKAQWYISRNLAAWVDGTTFRLTFTPQGRGKADDPYYLQGMVNQCVVCGNPEELNKHHVMPRVFRIHYPLSYKNSTSHDVLPLCTTCHKEYETVATIFKNKLAHEYGILIKNQPTLTAEAKQARKVLAARAALEQHSSVIPPKRRAELEVLAKQRVTDTFKRPPCNEYGAALVDQVRAKGEMFAFVCRWRQHFVDTMRPKYMPAHWAIDKNETSLP